MFSAALVIMLVWLGQRNDPQDPGTSFVHSLIHSLFVPSRGSSGPWGREAEPHTPDATHSGPGGGGQSKEAGKRLPGGRPEAKS